MKILGIDCAMRNLGLALLEVSGSSVSVVDLHLVVTESEAGKQVRKSSDDLRRARMLLAAVREWETCCDVVAAEIPSGAQSARASFGFGMAVGVLASIRKPLIQVSPAEVKRAVGQRSPTKADMIAWAMGEHPSAPWLTRKVKGALQPVAANEHLADAVAVGRAAMATDQWGMLSMLRAA